MLIYFFLELEWSQGLWHKYNPAHYTNKKGWDSFQAKAEKDEPQVVAPNRKGDQEVIWGQNYCGPQILTMGGKYGPC